jgi:hypothetical protein
MKLENGWELSVMQGSFNYCDDNTAEIAVFSPGVGFIPRDLRKKVSLYSSVIGYVPIDKLDLAKEFVQSIKVAEWDEPLAQRYAELVKKLK